MQRRFERRRLASMVAEIRGSASRCTALSARNNDAARGARRQWYPTAPGPEGGVKYHFCALRARFRLRLRGAACSCMAATSPAPSAASGRPPPPPPPPPQPPRQEPPVEIDYESIVLDVGHSFAKAGMAGNGAPRLYRDARVGRPDPSRPYPPGLGARPGVHNAAEFHRWRDYLRVLRPMERNKAINVDFLDTLWHDVFLNQLLRAPEEHPVLFVERTGLTKADRRALIQIAFESFNVPAYLPMPEAPLAVFASGRTTGLALCSGASATHVVPVYEGHALMHAATCFPLAGWHVTEALHATLAQVDRDLTVEAVQELKHIAAFVSLDYGHDSVAPSTARHYTLPATPSEGTRDVTLQSADRMACAEILFQPSLAG